MEQPNLNYIKEISGGDKAFEGKLIQILREEFPLEHKNYRIASEKNDAKEVAEIVHKIRHKISILGLVKGFELASEFEEALKNHQDFGLKKDFESVLHQMEIFIKTLS